MNLQAKFRAFKLDTPGSLCSVYMDGRYTLIEARLPIGGVDVLMQDMKHHGKETVDVLHITSWDTDHCSMIDLDQILNKLRPGRIEVPGYEPESEEGRSCRRILLKYDEIHQWKFHNTIEVTPQYISGLSRPMPFQPVGIHFSTDPRAANKNDRSLVMLFRSTTFSVLSLGDCESAEIASMLLKCEHITDEVDVLILPHHGADNGFITDDFLKAVKPLVAVATSNRGNEYEHPRPEVRAMLAQNGIPLMTSKDGDVYVIHEAGRQFSIAADFGADAQIRKKEEFMPKALSRQYRF
jgi:competence protein ComEC